MGPYTDLINADSGTLSATKVDLAAKARLENAGTVLGSEGVTLEADSVINRGSATTQGALAITARTQVANQGQGALKADHSVTVMASAIENAGMIEGADVQLEALQPFENQASGLVLAHGTLGLAANTVLNAGKINAEHRIEVTARERLENSINAECISEDRITIHQACELVNHGTLEGKTGVELLENERSPNQVFANGQAGKVCSHAVIALSVGGNSCNAGTIEGGAVTVQSKDAFTNIGNLNATDKVALTAEGKLENTGTVNGNAGVSLGAETVINQGTVITQRTLGIKAKTHVINQDQGVLKADQTITLATQVIHNAATIEGSDVRLDAEALENQSGHSIFAHGALTVTARTVSNAGQIKGDHDVDITVVERFENKREAECVAQAQLMIHQAPILENDGILKGKTAFHTTSPVAFNNGRDGQVLTEGALQLRCKDVSQNDGTLQGDVVTVDSHVFTNTHLLSATNTVRITAQNSFQNSGTVSGDGGVTFNAKSAVNQGTVKTKRTLQTVVEELLKNEGTGVLTADELITLSAQVIENEAMIVSLQEATLTAVRIENRAAGTLQVKLFTLDSLTVLNAGALEAKNLQLPKTQHLHNSGNLAVEDINAAALLIVDNLGTISITAEGILILERLNNRGGLKGGKQSHVRIEAQQFENTGEILLGALLLQSNLLQNLSAGKMLAEILALKTRQFDNQGTFGSVADCLSEQAALGGQATITGVQINNCGTFVGGHFVCKTQDEIEQYGFSNQGSVTVKTLEVSSKGISHTAGTITAENMVLTGCNLQLSAPAESQGNIELHHLGGVWEVCEQVKCQGELSFHWLEGRVVKQSWETLGGLRYSVSEHAKEPLTFMANQTAGAGLTVTTPTSIVVGTLAQPGETTLFSRQKLWLQGHALQIPCGILVGAEGVTLKSEQEIVVGHLDTARQSFSADKVQSAIQSHGTIEMETHGAIHWFQLELVGGGHLRLKGKLLDNVSSDVMVKDDAYLDIPLSNHRLLIKRDPGGYRVNAAYPWPGWHCHGWYRTQNASEKALSHPAKFRVGGQLSCTGEMEVFGSQISCASFEGKAPKLKSFIPFNAYTDAAFCGHKKVEKSWWEYFSRVIYQPPFAATFSVSGDLTAITERLEILGTLSAHNLRINGIKQGFLGAFDMRLTLAPMAVRQFRSTVPLLDYFTPSVLYKMSPGGEAVFKPSVLYKHPTPPLPRLLLQNDGVLSLNTQGLRRLLTPEQEEKCLMDLMMTELGRHFFSAYTDAGSIMRYLENNTLTYHRQGKKLIEVNPQTALVHNHALRVRSNPLAPFRLDKPCAVDVIVTLVEEDGTTEPVTCPVVFLPESLNNRRLRDGAGCLFSLGEIRLQGEAGSQLHIRGNLDAEGLVTYQDFALVSRTRNTYTRYETIVAHETHSRSITGKSKTKRQLAQIAITELQPGNETRALGERYENVTHVHRQVVNDQLGREGLVVQTNTFTDEGIVQNRPGPLQSVKQKGCFGIGGSRVSAQVVLRHAIGSVVQSEGPIRIEAERGTIQATVFLDEHGKAKSLELDIEELEYHSLLRMLEAENRANTHALMSTLQEQARTAKRKATQGTVRLLIALPVASFTGGIAQGLLQSFGSVTAVIGGGIVSGMTSAAIQRQNVLKGALEGGVLAGVGYGIENVPIVTTLPKIGQEAFKGAGAAAVSTIFHGGNLAENTLIGGASSGVAEQMFGGLPVAKAMSKSAVSTALHGGTVEDLVVNAAVSGYAALVQPACESLGRHIGDALTTFVTQKAQASDHGDAGPAQRMGSTHAASSDAPVPIEEAQSSVLVKRKDNVGKALKNQRAADRPIDTAPERARERLPQRGFLPDLETVTDEMSARLCQQRISVPEERIREAFREHPLLQGSSEEIQGRLIELGNARSQGRWATVQEALAVGFGWVFETTFSLLLGAGPAQASEWNPQGNEPSGAWNEDHKRFFGSGFMHEFMRFPQSASASQEPGRRIDFASEILSTQKKREWTPLVSTFKSKNVAQTFGKAPRDPSSGKFVPRLREHIKSSQRGLVRSEGKFKVNGGKDITVKHKDLYRKEVEFPKGKASAGVTPFYAVKSSTDTSATSDNSVVVKESMTAIAAVNVGTVSAQAGQVKLQVDVNVFDVQGSADIQTKREGGANKPIIEGSVGGAIEVRPVTVRGKLETTVPVGDNQNLVCKAEGQVSGGVGISGRIGWQQHKTIGGGSPNFQMGLRGPVLINGNLECELEEKKVADFIIKQ